MQKMHTRTHIIEVLPPSVDLSRSRDWFSLFLVVSNIFVRYCYELWRERWKWLKQWWQYKKAEKGDYFKCYSDNRKFNAGNGTISFPDYTDDGVAIARSIDSIFPLLQLTWLWMLTADADVSEIMLISKIDHMPQCDWVMERALDAICRNLDTACGMK